MGVIVKEEQELAAKLKAVQDRKKALVKKINDAAKPPGQASKSPPPGLDTASENFTKWRKENTFMVRQGVFDKKNQQNPALFQYTMPAQGKDSWLADIGIGITRDVTSLPVPAAASLMAEYHFNDATKGMKDTFQVGAGLDLFLGRDTEHAQLVSLKGGWRRDKLLSGEGTTGSLVWYPSFAPGIGDFWHSFGWVSGRLTPQIGIQVEEGNGAFLTFKDGRRTSFLAGVSLTGLLFPDYFGNRLEVNGTATYWNHIDTSGGYSAYDQEHLYYTAKVTYWLDRGKDDGSGLTEEEKHFGLSAGYENGDNPDEGTFAADVWKFGLSVKF